VSRTSSNASGLRARSGCVEEKCDRCPPPPSLSVALFVDQFRWACLQCWSQLQQLTSARLPGGYKSSATNTSLGAYIGRRLVSDTLSLDEFVGIPFAADTATTRFAPPADVESAHSQPFEALSFGPPAAAGRAKVAVRAPRTATQVQLQLNIWRPANIAAHFAQRHNTNPSSHELPTKPNSCRG
jgi:hypothetical protein